MKQPSIGFPVSGSLATENHKTAEIPRNSNALVFSGGVDQALVVRKPNSPPQPSPPFEIRRRYEPDTAALDALVDLLRLLLIEAPDGIPNPSIAAQVSPAPIDLRCDAP